MVTDIVDSNTHLQDTLHNLRRAQRKLGGEIHYFAQKCVVYTPFKASFFKGIMTKDAGRVRNKTVYRITVWSNNNAAFWFFPDEYEFYTSIPEAADPPWVTETERSEKFDALMDEYDELGRKIKALEADIAQIAAE